MSNISAPIAIIVDITPSHLSARGTGYNKAHLRGVIGSFADAP
jgi:hypothetical protein